MKLLIYWYSDDEKRLLIKREVIEASHSPDSYLIAWMTDGAIWKHYAIRAVSKDRFEEEIRKPPVEPTAT